MHLYSVIQLNASFWEISDSVCRIVCGQSSQFLKPFSCLNRGKEESMSFSCYPFIKYKIKIGKEKGEKRQRDNKPPLKIRNTHILTKQQQLKKKDNSTYRRT